MPKPGLPSRAAGGSPAAVGSGIAAVRGAIDVPENSATAIQERTARLLVALIEANGLAPERVVSALFTTTEDLDADFPAHAARRLGWTEVPMLNAREIPVPGSMARVVRVLLTVSGVASGVRLTPVYLEGAAALRPDLASRATRAGAQPAPAGRASSAAADPRLALIGLGQIGGSIGLAVRGRWRRAGFDRDRATLDAALAAGAIDEAAGSIEAACQSAALAVIAVPVDALPSAIDAAAAALPRGAALLDTGSARAPVTPALERAARRGVRAVGGHPLAGREGHGFAAARADLFANAPFALIPVTAPGPPGGAPAAAGSAAAIPQVVRALVADLGARALEVDPAAHDRALARTSHLPYLIACALREIGAGAADAGLSGPGFRDMTRLAASDPAMAGAYCRANAAEIAAAARELSAALERGLREIGAYS